MTRIKALCVLFAFTLAMVGCEPGTGTSADDDDDTAMPDDDDDTLDLEGQVVDPYLDGSGVSDAWIIVDTGTEVISTRSGADGTFAIPALPAESPVSLTFSGEDRQALTYPDAILAEYELPLQVSLPYRSTTYYDLDTMRVSGTVQGAPVGAWVLISAPNLSDYPYYPVESDAPVAFEFEVTVFGDESLPLSVIAQDGTTGELLAVGAAEVPVGEDAEVDVELEAAAPTDLTVSVNQPVLDGEPLAQLDMTYQSSLGLVYLGGYGPLSGWTRYWSQSVDGFELVVDHVPVEGYTPHIGVYLVEDFEVESDFAYALVPFDPADEELAVEVLDSPDLQGQDQFGPGTTLSWEPIEGAEYYSMYIVDGGSIAWYIGTEETQIAFPTLPDGFDASILLDSEADFTVRANAYEETDGENGIEYDYKISGTVGGTATALL